MSGPETEDNFVKEIAAGEGEAKEEDLGINKLTSQPSFLAVSSRSSLRMSMTPEQEQKAFLRDMEMIFIGNGPKAERICERRMQEGGRLLWLKTSLEESQPPRPCTNPGAFVFRPPDFVKATDPELDRVRKKFGDTPARMWSKKGPDIVTLQEGQIYSITEGKDRVTVWNKDQTIDWQVSGKVEFENSEDGPEDVIVETRYDALKTIKMPHNIPVTFWCFYMTVLFLVWFYCNKFDTTEDIPWWRLSYLTCALPFHPAVPQVWALAASGVADTSLMGRFVAMFGISFGEGVMLVLPFNVGEDDPSPRYTALFWVCGVGVIVMLSVAIPYHWLKFGLPTKANLMWFAVTVNMTLGCWFYLYALSLGYQAANLVAPQVANAVLPFAIMVSEGAFIYTTQTCYRALVFKGKMEGEQSVPMVFSVCIIHAFCESVGFGSMLCGAILSNSYEYLTAVVISFMLHVFGRHGWIRFFVTKTCHSLGLRPQFLKASTITKLHDEAKFLMGYPRFCGPIGLLISNIIRGKDKPLFNDAALVCLFVNIAAEALEDMIVFSELVPYSPAPPVAAYRGLMNLDPTQLYAIDDEIANVQRTTQAKRSPSTTIRATLSNVLMSTKMCTRALSLHGLRKMDWWEVGSIVAPSAVFVVCLMQLVLGPGLVSGLCDGDCTDVVSDWSASGLCSIPPNDRVSEQAFVWTGPIRCYFGNKLGLNGDGYVHVR